MGPSGKNTWIAAGGDAAAMAALCEHLPPGAVIVTTRAELEAQMEAAPEIRIILLDDSADMTALAPAFEPLAAELHILHLKSSSPPALSFTPKSIHLVDKPAKISSLIRLMTRLQKQVEAATELVISGTCMLARARQLLINPASGKQAELTEKESQILEFLCRMRPDVAAREQLHREVWGYQGELNTHTLETHIYRLRSKLKDIGATDVSIENSAAGYRLGSAE